MPQSPEEKKIKKHEYYLKNRKHIIANVHNYQKKNRKVVLRKKKAYNADHAKERNEKQKAYAAEHKGEIQIYLKDYYEKHGEEIRLATLRNSGRTIAELEDLLRKIFTLKCFFCGKTDKQPRLGISFHKIDGESHDYHTVPKLRYILAHPEEFVPVCRHHHILTHRLMMEGFTWEEIVKLIQAKRGFLL